MFKPGERIQMTKGYKGIRGVIDEKTDSPFEMYIITLEAGIKIVAGPSSFVAEERPK